MSTSAQHMVALQSANRVRLGNARVKAEIAALPRAEGFALVAEVLLDPADPAASIRVGALLDSIDHNGPKVSQAQLRAAGIWSRERFVRELTVRQRRALAEVLRAKAADA